jgi:hypothetical protein
MIKYQIMKYLNIAYFQLEEILPYAVRLTVWPLLQTHLSLSRTETAVDSRYRLLRMRILAYSALLMDWPLLLTLLSLSWTEQAVDSRYRLLRMRTRMGWYYSKLPNWWTDLSSWHLFSCPRQNRLWTPGIGYCACALEWVDITVCCPTDGLIAPPDTSFPVPDRAGCGLQV